MLLSSAFAATKTGGFGDKRIDRGGVGLKLGLIHTAKVRENTVTHDSKISFNSEIFFDVPIYRKLALTITTDIHNVRVYNHHQMMLDLSIGAKVNFYKQHLRMAWRPAFTIGFAHLAHFAHLESSNFMTWHLSTEVLFIQTKNPALLLELSVFGATGGNKDTDLRWGPVWMIRAGVMY